MSAVANPTHPQAAPAADRRGPAVQPGWLRVVHWVNVLSVFVMVLSGWRIYNSDPILPFSFPVELTLGGSYDGSVDIHNEDGLAGALQWHFAGMWLLTINGIVYLAYRSIFRQPARLVSSAS